MKSLYFDIETGPLSADQIDIPPFDPGEVKTGNIKDPVKVAEKIAEAERRHRQVILDNAALDPVTGLVLLISIQLPSGERLVIDDANGEAELLRTFWDYLDDSVELVGFNIKSFDLPFLIKRSWKHGVNVPDGLRFGRYWDNRIVDLRDNWLLGDPRGRGSLDSICKFLGLGSKTGNGADFAALYATDKPAATAYALNDLALTVALHKRIG